MALSTSAVDIETEVSAVDAASALAAAERVEKSAETSVLATALRDAGLTDVADVSVVLRKIEKDGEGMFLGDQAILGIGIGGFMICTLAFTVYYRKKTALTRLERVEFGNI